MSNDLTEHSRFRSPNSNVGLYRRCLPVAYPFFFEDQTRCFCRPELKKILHGTVELGTWQHDSGFKRLTRFRSRRISKLCKMKLFLSMTAGYVNGISCRTGVIVFTLSDLTPQVGTVVASHADILSARHALLLDELVRQ